MGIFVTVSKDDLSFSFESVIIKRDSSLHSDYTLIKKSEEALSEANDR